MSLFSDTHEHCYKHMYDELKSMVIVMDGMEVILWDDARGFCEKEIESRRNMLV